MNNEDEVKLYYVTPAYDPAVRVLLYATNDAEAYGRVSVEGEVAVDGGPYALTSNPTNARMDGENLSVGFLSQADADRWTQQNQPNNKYSTAELTKLTEACGGYEDIDVCAELTQEAEKLGMYEKPMSVSADAQKAAGYKLRKYDENKLDLTLVEPCIIEAIAKVSTYGMKKYSAVMPDGTFVSGRDNWKLAFETSNDVQRYMASAWRHLLEYRKGNKTDDESGLSHLYHLAFNVMLMIYGEEMEKKANNGGK